MGKRQINYVNFIKIKKSYMKINLKIFIYDFFAFANKTKVGNKLHIKSYQELNHEVILFDRKNM